MLVKIVVLFQPASRIRTWEIPEELVGAVSMALDAIDQTRRDGIEREVTFEITSEALVRL